MRKKLNPQVKFKVVLEALQDQKTFPEIARTYGIRPQLISIIYEKFSFTRTKPQIDFFFQIPVQFGRRARNGRGGRIDISEGVDYS